MLGSMRAIYDVRIPKVRKSLATLAKYVQHRHPRGASFPNTDGCFSRRRESQPLVSHKFLKHFNGSRARVSSVVAPHYGSYF
jgi:hypothetical protein